MDNELLWQDRIAVIQAANKKYDLENNAYLSFSGGKDSTILHYLLDIALPNNRIPRVFINTGIEYNDIVKFVQKLASKDERIVIINTGKSIKKVLEEKGYPFKSKQHSLRVEQFNKGSTAKFINKYLWQTDYRGKYLCPKILLYQFEKRGKYNYSNRCCYELKKKPIAKWEKQNHRNIAITGMRQEEGGNRQNLKSCIIIDYKGKLSKFHPLLVVDETFENYLIQKYDIQLCKLYYPPYNFTRTGCKGCPFALDLQENLNVMERYLPNEKKQCELIWKPVYEEYRRLNYRLKNNNQMSIDDFI